MIVADSHRLQYIAPVPAQADLAMSGISPPCRQFKGCCSVITSHVVLYADKLRALMEGFLLWHDRQSLLNLYM